MTCEFQVSTNNGEELLRVVLETEGALESTEVHLNTLNTHLATLVGGPEYTKLYQTIEEINEAYIQNLTILAVQKAKAGIVGKTWYKKST